MQPDYVHEVTDDVDLVIVGGYYGTQRHAHLLSHFLLAAAVKDDTAGAVVQGAPAVPTRTQIIRTNSWPCAKWAVAIPIGNCTN